MVHRKREESYRIKGKKVKTWGEKMTGIFSNHDKKEKRLLGVKQDAALDCHHLEDYPRLPEEIDDTGRFRRAINAMPSGSVLIVPEGHYYAEEICIRKPVSIRFAREAVVEAVHVNAPYIFKWEGGLGYHQYCLAEDLKRGGSQFYNLADSMGSGSGRYDCTHR